jgi:RNA polymerase sigma-70 factor (ECF subfamily)
VTVTGQFERRLAGAQTGAEWALAALYRESHPSLLRYLRAQAPVDGEDIASQVWIEAASGLVRFSGDEADFRRWLFTIARRRLIDFRRREGRRRAVLASLEDASASPDPQAQALDASETEIALKLLASLPPKQAEVVFLRVLAGLEVEDVALMLGKTRGAVRVLQHRALTTLREQLMKEQERVVTG